MVYNKSVDVTNFGCGETETKEMRWATQRCVHSRPLRCKLLWLHGSSACADRVSLANPYFFKLQRSPLGRASLAPERRTYLQHPHRQHVSMYNAVVPLGRASVARTRRLHCLLRIRKSDHGSVTVAGWNLATHLHSQFFIGNKQSNIPYRQLALLCDAAAPLGRANIARTKSQCLWVYKLDGSVAITQGRHLICQGIVRVTVAEWNSAVR